jgi:hypothetical protein
MLGLFVEEGKSLNLDIKRRAGDLVRKKFHVGDLVVVRKWDETEWAPPKKWAWANTSLENLVSSSSPGNTTITPGDTGLVVECPVVWGFSDRLIGVLFHDMKKYVACEDIELLRSGSEGR